MPDLEYEIVGFAAAVLLALLAVHLNKEIVQWATSMHHLLFS